MNKYYLIIFTFVIFTLAYYIINIVELITNPIYKYTSTIGNEPLYKDSLLESSQILTNKNIFTNV